MLSNNKGLTKFYNDFHGIEFQSDDIKRLRTLQTEMNDAVRVAYGFSDIDPEVRIPRSRLFTIRKQRPFHRK